MSPGLVTLIMFGGLLVLLATGLPLAFVLGGIGVLVTAFLWDFGALFMVVSNVFGTMWNVLFIAIPLFIFMGVLLERSGVAEALFDTFYAWSGRIRGGLAMATVIICAIFAAMTASTAAATITMGLIALPAMLKRGYNKYLAVGTVGASGTLGPLIPPSALMIVLGVMNQLSVGQLFMGGVFPGLLFASLFMLYIGTRALFQPTLCPATPEKYSFMEKIVRLRAVILPLLIIIAVLGSIFFGIATPTEAGAVGGLAVLIATIIHRRLTWQVIKESTRNTIRISGMVIWIFFGAIPFAAAYTALGGIDFVSGVVMGLGLNRYYILILMMVIIFFLGMVMEPTGIIVICSPVFFPIIMDLGFNPIWFSMLFMMNMMVGYLTPPVGYNIFYLKAIAPKGISLLDIYRAFVPFIILQIIGLVVVVLFPQIALWLPSMMIR